MAMWEGITAIITGTGLYVALLLLAAGQDPPPDGVAFGVCGVPLITTLFLLALGTGHALVMSGIRWVLVSFGQQPQKTLYALTPIVIGGMLLSGLAVPGSSPHHPILW
jgi:hypothetical protein